MQKFVWSITLMNLPLIVALSAIVWPTEAIAQENQPIDRVIATVLVRRSDQLRNELTEDKIELTARPVELKPDDNISKLLLARGLYLNTDALSIIYDLNPELEDLNKIKPGYRLILPEITGGNELQRALDSGFLIHLSIDRDQKDALRSNVRMLQALIARVSALRIDHFENPTSKEKSLASLRSVFESALLHKIATDTICVVILKYEEQDYQKALAKAPAPAAQKAISYPQLA